MFCLEFLLLEQQTAPRGFPASSLLFGAALLLGAAFSFGAASLFGAAALLGAAALCQLEAVVGTLEH